MLRSTYPHQRLPRWFILTLGSLFVFMFVWTLSSITPVQASNDKGANSVPADNTGSTEGVIPVTMSLPNNNACSALGYDFERKVDPPQSGTYRLGDTADTVDVSIDKTKVYVNWMSSGSIAAVVVKGGKTANVYQYDPALKADGQLHSPINASGKFAQISHISFCYDAEAPAAPSTPEPAGSTITGTVWSDNNYNRSMDAGEMPFAGVTIEVYLDGDEELGTEAALVATTTTDSAGSYTFANMDAGSYIIKVIDLCASPKLVTVDGVQTITVDIAAHTYCVS